MGEEVLMDTGTQQLAFEVATTIIAIIFGLIAYYGKRFLTTNEYAIKYNLNNEATERILENAVLYAEAKAKGLAKDQINKRELSIKYIDSIKPELIKEYGDKLEIMLDRKVQQVIDKK